MGDGKTPPGEGGVFHSWRPTPEREERREERGKALDLKMLAAKRPTGGHIPRKMAGMAPTIGGSCAQRNLAAYYFHRKGPRE